MPAKLNIIRFFLLLLLLHPTAKVLAQPSHPNQPAASAAVKRVYYGQASFYSNKFNGRETASGEIFHQSKMTCACNVLSMGTWVKVTNLRNGKWVIVKVNDRLHKSMRRIVDLTSAAAHKLGFVSNGLTRVKVEVLGKKKPAGIK